MEKRDKSIKIIDANNYNKNIFFSNYAYEKSGKSFINIEKINSIFDSIPRYENYIEDPSLQSPSSPFNEKDTIIFDQTNKSVGNQSFSNTDHFLKIPRGKRRVNSNTYSDDYFITNYITKNIATPSTLPTSGSFNINFNSDYNGKNNINELLKFPEFIKAKNKSKGFVENLYNDSQGENIFSKTDSMFITNGQYGLLNETENPDFYKQYENLNVDYQKDRKDLIESTGNYSLLNSNQKKEKVINIDLNASKTSYALMTFQNSIFKDTMNEVDLNTDFIEFSKITNISEGVNTSRLANDVQAYKRRYHKWNTPFVIWDTSTNAWEYRGIIYPKYHMEKNTAGNIGFLGIDSLGNSNNIPYTGLENIVRINDKIKFFNSFTGFLSFVKNYFIERCCLTNTPSHIIKKNLNQGIRSFPFASIATSQFGFPVHPKFHALPRNLISLKKYIQQPFVLTRTSFSTNVELICEFKKEEDNSFYEEPINAVLNYHIIKQKKVENSVSINNLKRPFSPVCLNLNEKSTDIINNSNNSLSIGLYDFLKTESNLDEYSLQARRSPIGDSSLGGVYKENNNYDPKLPSFSYESNSIINSYDYVREIINTGNVLFIAPPYDIISNNQNSALSQQNFISLLSQNNFDNIKVIEYNNHLNLLDDNNLTTILDFSGSININSPCRLPAFSKNAIASHLLNFDFELPAGSNIEYNVGTRTLTNIEDARSLKNNKTFENIQSDTSEIFNVEIPSSYSSFDNRDENNIYDYGFEKIEGLRYKNISEYVLYPDDEIYICLSISPVIHPKPIKQILKVKGKSNISLYGYYLNDDKKTYGENDLLKNYNSNNLPNITIGNIHTNNQYSDNSFTYIRNYLDNVLNKNVSFYGNRGLIANPNESIIRSGRTYNPYLTIYSDYYLNTDEKVIYDDAYLQYSIEHETVDDVKYYTNNVFNNLCFYKDYSYKPVNENYNETSINRNLRVPKVYYSSKSYGLKSDMVQQRLYTTMFDRKNNKKESIVTKEFFNSDDGSVLSNLTNVINHNKSLTYELIDSRVNRFVVDTITYEGIEKIPYPFNTEEMKWNSNISWSLEDITKLKHVAFMENVSS